MRDVHDDEHNLFRTGTTLNGSNVLVDFGFLDEGVKDIEHGVARPHL
jgi:hypothetical protein